MQCSRKTKCNNIYIVYVTSFLTKPESKGTHQETGNDTPQGYGQNTAYNQNEIACLFLRFNVRI